VEIDLKQTRLPPFPLDVVFPREAETAMTLHGGLAGMPRSMGRMADRCLLRILREVSVQY
jgi:hypothetical protein